MDGSCERVATSTFVTKSYQRMPSRGAHHKIIVRPLFDIPRHHSCTPSHLTSSFQCGDVSYVCDDAMEYAAHESLTSSVCGYLRTVVAVVNACRRRDGGVGRVVDNPRLFICRTTTVTVSQYPAALTYTCIYVKTGTGNRNTPPVLVMLNFIFVSTRQR